MPEADDTHTTINSFFRSHVIYQKKTRGQEDLGLTWTLGGYLWCGSDQVT